MTILIDLVNGPILFLVKATTILLFVQYLTERSRELSAEACHQLFMGAGVAVLLIPILAAVLPELPLLSVPAAVDGWMSMPLVRQTGVTVTYNGPLAAVACVYLLMVSWLLFYLLLGVLQVRAISLRARVASKAMREMVADVAQSLQLRHSPRISVSGEVASPQVWGALRPEVLLPIEAKSWSSSRLRRVLVHELAHIRRRDWLWKLSLQVMAALLWFLPSIWLTVRRAAWYAELACDDWVVALEKDRAAYAGDLLDLSQRSGSPAIGAVSLHEVPRLYLRIRAVLDGSRIRSGAAGAARGQILFLLLCLLLPLSSVRAVVQNPTDEYPGRYGYNRFVLPAPSLVDPAPPPVQTRRFSPGDLADLRNPVAAPPTFQEELVIKHLQLDEGDVKPEALAQVAIHLDPRPQMRQAEPRVRALPSYPQAALRRGVEGRVVAVFDVDLDGRVINPRILHAEPGAVFERAVLEALEQYRFRPLLIDGANIITKNMTETFVFQLATGTADNPSTNYRQLHRLSTASGG